MSETRFPNGISGGNGADLDIHSGSDIALYPTGNIWISQGTKLIFEGTVPDDFEAKLQATTVTADRDIILPDASGTLALTTDIPVDISDLTDTGNLLSGGGGGGLSGRTTVSVTTASLADAATDNVDITSAAKAYGILSIEVDAAAWVRVYSSASARTNDSGRTELVDPAPDAGVHAEIITTGATTVKFTPANIGWNDESPVTDTIYLAITNKSGSTTTITATLTILPLES